ncbi:hypothetical protein M9458_007977, partial [Cirrhinus mrigala]
MSALLYKYDEKEIGQIYESCSSVRKKKEDLQIHFSSLPSLAAEMMICGFPLELMDGDAAHVPVIWISAVLDQLIHKLGDQRVFVLSVLGIRSSGKSTMLNAMFGLQFAVSAGRTTRGAFMQLIRVSDEMKTQMNFDYILVVHTEGLRALELTGKSTRHHDNELATFVVGLANLTLINIFGENPAEMQDILQIVVQAFMRMKKNVSDVTAGEKNMEGRRRLQKLDKMTKLAAEEEVSDAECFSDIIRFDVYNAVKYIPQLWEGNPRMAPPNPNYSYKKLETEYSNAMMETENKLHNKIENEAIDNVNETDFKIELRKTSEEVKKSIKIDAQRTHHENILYEKSKELALKLKDKANDDGTLKKEFDLFWKCSVMKIIIRDTPAVRDIDIMRDVSEIFSDIYESLSVDHWEEKRDIFTVWSYSDYVKVKKLSRIAGAFTNVYRSVKGKLGYILCKEDEAQIRSLVTDVSQQTDRMIQSYNISKMGYNKSCIHQLAYYIRARIIEHQEGQVRYVFKNEFFMDLFLSIFKRANKMITDQHRLFMEANDPVIYVEKKREEYNRIFQKYCHGSASAVIFGEIICQKLKEPIEQSVYKKTVRDLACEIKINCESLNGNTSNLEKHILKTLAEQENIDKYMNYIHKPRDDFKSFIRDEVSRFITDQLSVSVLPKMKENIELLQQKIMKAAHESTEHVQVNSGDAGLTSA